MSNLKEIVEPLESVALHTPFTLKNGAVLKNRLIKSSMSEGLADMRQDPTSQLETLYGTWAEGGHAANITGNVMVDRNALGEHGNVVLDEQSNLVKFRAWAEAGTVNNCHLWMQLNHPGKQAPSYLTPEPVAPSPIPLEGDLSSNFKPPRALTGEEIEQIITRFATSAQLAKNCGFTGVQIHGAHGYLISQFLSPHHNQRTDEWGGSLEGRMKFLREVYKAIRAAVGDAYPVVLKLNSADFSRGGFEEGDSLKVAQALAEDGIDLIEISGGSYEKLAFVDGAPTSERTTKREAFFIDYAEKLRTRINVPLMVTGGFRSAQGMLDPLNSNAMDLIGAARCYAVDPICAQRLLSDDQYTIKLSPGSTGFAKLDTATMMRAQWYQMQIHRLAKGKQPKPNMGGWSVLFQTIFSMGRYAFKRNRV